MTEADYFRAQAARCLTLRRAALRSDLQQVLPFAFWLSP